MSPRFFLLSLALVFASALCAQERKQVLYAEDKGSYCRIPENAFADSVLGVVYPDLHNRNTDPLARPLVIQWFSKCLDGSYRITITPQQIYFHTGHDNPNPKHLYWCIDIDSSQYAAIRAAWLSRLPPGWIRDTFDTEDRQYWFLDEGYEKRERSRAYSCDRLLDRQLQLIALQINGVLPLSVPRVDFPPLSGWSGRQAPCWGSSEAQVRNPGVMRRSN